MVIKVDAAFPIEWDREYYTIEETVKEKRAPCICCDDWGKVTIRGVEYKCPRCEGNWRKRDVVGTTTSYIVGRWFVDYVRSTSSDTSVVFRRKNGNGSFMDSAELTGRDLHDMTQTMYSRRKKFYDDYKFVMSEVRRLNAEERKKGADKGSGPQEGQLDK